MTKVSDGWLANWKQRFNITFKTLCGDGGLVDLNVVTNWTENILPNNIKDYLPKDIYNFFVFLCFLLNFHTILC